MRSLVLAALLAIPSTLSAQRLFDDERTPPDTTPGRGLLKLGFNNNGISFGNSARWNGLRGVHVGLLNRARNNKPPFRWLPIVNMHL
jgi:hypothetical protein